MKIFNVLRFLPTALVIICFLPGCYTLNPATTGEASTIQIFNFYNESGGGPAGISQLLTEKVRDFYQQNTNLSLVNQNADWEISGKIVNYTVVPIAPQANETSGGNRLKISVLVNFLNKAEPEESFERVFSFFDDFSENQTLSQVEDQLVDVILDQIIYDLYTATTSDW